jgi:adenine deaminase
LFNQHHKVLDGHSPLLSKYALQAYRLSGISTNHEATFFNEIKEHLESGFYVFLRDASYANISDIELKKLFNSQLSLERCCWCTDDKTPLDISKTGLIEYSIRRAIRLGLDPIQAICMGTINPATCYNLKDQGAIVPGYQANLLIVDNLRSFNIIDVYVKGKLFAKNNNNISSQLKDVKRYYSNIKVDYQILRQKLNTIDLNKAQPCIQPIPNSLLTELIMVNHKTSLVINKIVNIERHKLGKQIGVGLVSGFDINDGALASSIAHDAHNITAIGDGGNNIELAIRTLQKNHGGFVVVSHGKVLAQLPLPIGGLISDRDDS